MKPIIILQLIVEKWSVVWSAPSYTARRKLTLPQLKPLTVKMYFILSQQEKTWGIKNMKFIFMAHMYVKVGIQIMQKFYAI